LIDNKVIEIYFISSFIHNNHFYAISLKQINSNSESQIHFYILNIKRWIGH